MLAEELGEEEAEGGSEGMKLAAEEVVGGVGGFDGKGEIWLDGRGMGSCALQKPVTSYR